MSRIPTTADIEAHVRADPLFPSLEHLAANNRALVQKVRQLETENAELRRQRGEWHDAYNAARLEADRSPG